MPKRRLALVPYRPRKYGRRMSRALVPYRRRGGNTRAFRRKRTYRRRRRVRGLARSLQKYLSELKFGVFTTATRAAPSTLTFHNGSTYIAAWNIAQGSGPLQREGLKIKAKGMVMDYVISSGTLTAATSVLTPYWQYKMKVMVIRAIDDSYSTLPELIWEDNTVGNADKIFTNGFYDGNRQKWKLLYSRTFICLPHTATSTVTNYAPTMGSVFAGAVGSGEPKPRHIHRIHKYLPLKSTVMEYQDAAAGPPIKNNIMVLFCYNMDPASFSAKPGVWGQHRVAYYDD